MTKNDLGVVVWYTREWSWAIKPPGLKDYVYFLTHAKPPYTFNDNVAKALKVTEEQAALVIRGMQVIPTEFQRLEFILCENLEVALAKLLSDKVCKVKINQENGSPNPAEVNWEMEL